MRGVNKVILIGALGKDIELRFSANGKAVARASLATAETWTDKASGEKQESTEWHKLVLFNKTAEIAAEYLKKGSKIYVEGKLRNREFVGKDDVKKYITEVVVDEFQMLDSKSDSLSPKLREKATEASEELSSVDDDMPF